MADPVLEETLDLVSAANGGSESARDALLERYYPRITRIVSLRMGKTLGQFQDFEDVVQETLIDVFRGLHRFEPRSEGSFRHWLAGVVENNIRDLSRRSSAQKRGSGRARDLASYGTSVLTESLFSASDPSPSEAAVGNEFEERVEAAILSLDENSRRIIEMRHICGMSHEEIADELGYSSASSARSLLSRAMSQLAGLVE
jgi:RNA polymerase sigma-70 factor (ECF subfamily)